MEIIEILSFNLDKGKDILEVTFRTNDDSDETMRYDNVECLTVKQYGYELFAESFDFFNDDEEDDDLKGGVDFEIDEEALISFLNEYYTLHPELLPRAEIY